MAKTFRCDQKQYRGSTIPVQRATQCIFCGNSGPLTKEHVFSRWTHRFLPPRSRSQKNYSVMHVNAQIQKSDRSLMLRPGDIRDWQIQCVCAKICNNGWMRERVENVARPIMLPLIEGDQFLKGNTTLIMPHQQRIIATWAAMKAMVAEFDPQSTVTTHHMQRKYLMQRLAPPVGWTVWIGPYLRASWPSHWGSTHFFYASPKQHARMGSDIRATHHNSHVSTQVIGKLFIQVIRSPAHYYVERWRFNLPDRGSLFRIWPATDTVINWPGQFMSDRDADYALGAVHNDLLKRTASVLADAIKNLAG